MRISVLPEELRNLAGQLRRAAGDLRDVQRRLGNALSGMDWDTRRKMAMDGEVNSARQRAGALADQAENMGRRLESRAEAFEEADRQGVSGLSRIVGLALTTLPAIPKLLGWPFTLIKYTPYPPKPRWPLLRWPPKITFPDLRLPRPPWLPDPKQPEIPSGEPEPEPRPAELPAEDQVYKDAMRQKLTGTEYLGYGETYGEGKWAGSLHPGIDVKGPVGEAVLPLGPGKIAKVGNEPSGYGSYVVIEHTLRDGSVVYALYAHMSEDSVAGLQVGQPVTAQTSIGSIGLTGNTRAEWPHTHVEVRTKEAYIDWKEYKDLVGDWHKYWLDPVKVLEQI